jgi:DNA-binding SARP family transcriptional activator
MLARERLLDRLRRRWGVAVTVITAPAGYGKTTLLTQSFTANQAAPVGIDCWLTCDPSLTTVSALGTAMVRAMGAERTGPGPVSVDDAARVVLEAMWQRSPQQVTLIVDDVHEIPVGSGAANLLATVIAELPANGHVVLAGRTGPPLALARLDVAGRVLRLDEDEMVFTEGELAAFADLRHVDGARVAGCGGWPALAELWASARAGVSTDYVGEEVLAHLPAERRRQLALLASLGPFDDELAHQVLLADEVDVDELLSGLPLVSRMNGGRSLHGLWRTLLAGDAPAPAIAEARRVAGVTLLDRGDVDRAMRLLVDAGAWDEVGRAIVVALGAAHPPVPRDVLEEWYKLLPNDVRDSPSGGLLASVIGVEGDLGGAWEDFERCAAAFRELGEVTGELACLVQLGQIAWWSDRSDLLAQAAMRTFELDRAGHEEATPFACIGRAMLYDIADQSREMLAELDRIPPGTLGEPWLGLVDWARAIAHLQLGYPVEAQAAAERAMTFVGTMHGQWAGGTRLQTIWFQGRLDEVTEALPRLLDQVRESGYRNSTVLVAAQCSLAHAVRGRRDEAERYLMQARAMAAMIPEAPLVDTALAVAAANLAILDGDEVAAAETLTAYVARHPIGEGLCVAAQRRHLALLYVLVPATRPVWDAAELGPAWALARDLARAVVAVRERRPLPRDGVVPDTGIVEAHLPPAWLAELGVAALVAGRPHGQRLLDDSWPLTRPGVEAMAREARGRMGKAARDVLAQLPVPPERPLELRLLGPVELRRSGEVVRATDWRRERVRSLLAHLVFDGTVSRSQMADDLWPGLDPDAQARNLRVTLTYLLRILEPDRSPRAASFFVRQDGANLSLHPGDWLTVDLWELDRLCEQAAEADRQGSPAAALDAALRAVGLWRGEPIELLSEHWAIAAYEQRRQRFAAVATRAGELLLARRRFAQAHALAERALDVDPWLEAAHRLVVAIHRAAGNHLAAHAALRRYRTRAREVGLDPDEATLMLERLLKNLP